MDHGGDLSVRMSGTVASPEDDLDIDQEMAMIEKSQQLAGHFPDGEALNRARRVLTGQITVEQAYSELEAKYS